MRAVDIEPAVAILILECVVGAPDVGTYRAEVRREVLETLHALLRAGHIRLGEGLAGFVVAPALPFAGEVGVQLRRHPCSLLGELVQFQC